MIILISGRQGSGKTTLAKGLCKALNASHIKFADPLYEMHEAIKNVAQRYDIPFNEKEGTLLQLLGTEWGRKVKGDDVWVNACKSKVAERLSWSKDSVVVIDDARFENELKAFPEAFTIRLYANEEERKGRADGWRDNTQHASETGLDNVQDEEFNLVVDTTFHDKGFTLAIALQKIDEYCGTNGL
jgi:uridine kinase